MSTLSFSPRAASSAGFIPSRIVAFFETVVAEVRARRAARSVEALSDDMLHDIGIARGEIDRAVRVGRWRP